MKSILGELSLTRGQAQQLGVASHTRLSPYLELCCLRVSANVSYEHTEKDVEVLTGIRVPAKTQQRLVHRQTFELPQSEQPIEELSADGGKIRVRTPIGEECRWLDYKGVRLHEFATGACFQDNQQLIDWVGQQPLSYPLTCLGDGLSGCLESDPTDGCWPSTARDSRLVSPDGEPWKGRRFNSTLKSG